MSEKKLPQRPSIVKKQIVTPIQNAPKDLPPIPLIDGPLPKKKIDQSNSFKNKYPAIEKRELEKEVIRQNKFATKRWILFLFIFAFLSFLVLGFNWHIRLKMDRMILIQDKKDEIIESIILKNDEMQKQIKFLNEKIKELEKSKI